MTRESDSTSRAVGEESPTIRKKSRAASINPKKKAAHNIQREISDLKGKCKELEEKRITSEESDEPQENAGDQFGGRKGKNQKNWSD